MKIYLIIFFVGGLNYGLLIISLSFIIDGVRRFFLDFWLKFVLMKKIGCFDYKVIDDKLFGSYVIVFFIFFKEFDVKIIEEYCNND